MSRTRIRLLVVVLLGAGLAGWLLLDAYRATGAVGPLVPWPTGALPVTLAAALLVQGRRVRRLVNGDPTSLTPLGAARVAVLAQASSRVGAGVAGFYGGLLAVNLTGPATPLYRDQLLPVTLAAGGFLVLTAVGWLVERWCRLPEDDGDDPPGRAGPAGPEPA